MTTTCPWLKSRSEKFAKKLLGEKDIEAVLQRLDRLTQEDPASAELVKLRYFAGLTIPQAAELLGVSPRQADFLWSFARAWLRREIEGGS